MTLIPLAAALILWAAPAGAVCLSGAAQKALLSRVRAATLRLSSGDAQASGFFLKDPTSATVLQGDSTTAALAGVTIEPAGGSTEPSMNNLIGTVPLGNA